MNKNMKNNKENEFDLRYEIKIFLEESKKDRRQAAEDRKQATEDRKQAADDRRLFTEYCRRADKERLEFREYIRRSDKKFDQYYIQAEKDRKRAEKIGMLIIKQLKEIKQILIRRNGKLPGR